MSRKNRRAQQRKPQRMAAQRARQTLAQSPAQPTTTAPTASAKPVSVAPAPSETPRQRERPGATRVARDPVAAQASGVPMDRVPYFGHDLRRIAVTAGLMFVVLIVGSFFIR